MKRATVLVVALAAFGACNLNGTVKLNRPGLLRLQASDSITYVVPDTVSLNTSFDISVNSFGGGCDEKGETHIIMITDVQVELRPFDRTDAESERGCPDVIKTFTHTGSLQFTKTGAATITVIGRDWHNGPMFRTRNVFVK